MTAESDSEKEFDPKRRLCSDGSCVGVLDPNGRCSTCGQTASGAPEADDAPQADDAADDLESVDASVAASPPGDRDGFDPSRRLCSDDACIGVIGEAGRCNACGKPA